MESIKNRPQPEDRRLQAEIYDNLFNDNYIAEPCPKCNGFAIELMHNGYNFIECQSCFYLVRGCTWYSSSSSGLCDICEPSNKGCEKARKEWEIVCFEGKTNQSITI